MSLSTKNREIPDNVKDIYNLVEYNRWLQYSKEGNRLSLIHNIASGVVLLLLFIFKVYGKIASLFDNVYLNSLIVIFVFAFVNFVIDFIFDFISTFKIEEKYGFNKTKFPLFLKDEIMSLVIEVGLISGIVCLLVSIYPKLGYKSLLIFGAVVLLFVFISFMFSRKFMRLFNKFSRLPDGELRDKLNDLLNKYGYKVKEIEVMNASKRTTKANAMFTGFGKQKTIILFDNLLNILDDDEIVAVFSHELGHGKHHDTINGFLRNILMILVVTIVLFLLLYFNNIYLDNGFNIINYGFAIVIMLECIFNTFMPVIDLISNYFSRKQEYKADSFAKEAGYKDQLISGLKKLTKTNLSSLNPHPIIVKLVYSHPTLSQRIDNLK